MKKLIYRILLMTTTLVLSSGMFLGEAFAEKQIVFKKHKISISVPSRWEVSKIVVKRGGKSNNIVLSDSKGENNVTIIVRYKHPEYSSIGDYLTTRLMPNLLKRYTRGSTYSEFERKTGSGTLGSGQKVKTIESSLEVNNSRDRNMVVAYLFHPEDKKIWYLIWVRNIGGDYSTKRELGKILNGINLHRKEQVSVDRSQK